ncbi:MAG: 2-oxo acid dehydrogenase subunit E2 [Pseudomonadales bacterium]|nr:2-oxo acid dehydrogenase subunit E2 [Pseudomonadales bacterium]
MPTPIYLVKVGMNMTEGVVEEWYIADGATVEKGQLIYRLETEKVNLDVDAEASGVVRHVVGEGITLQPGDIVGYIYAPGEPIPDSPVAPDATAVVAAAPAGMPPPTRPAAAAGAAPARGTGERILASPAARRMAATLRVELATLGGTGPGGRIVEADVRAAAARGNAIEPEDGDRTAPASPSSPIARKLARELGVDLAQVDGTGPGGRITKEDVEQAAARKAATVPEPASPPAGASLPAGGRTTAVDRTVPIRGMRRTIAARMHESLATMAQLTMNMDVVMDDAVRLRNQLLAEWQAEGLRTTYTDLVIRAVARALAQHPAMNSVFGEREITYKGEINVGMAVAVDDGLLVPVVRQANLRGMHELVTETARLAAAARDGRLSVDDLQGGTFTVTALGMYGVDSFTPIINAPQVGILGVNRIRDEVAWDGDRPVRQQRMMLSLTWDHRALDGAPAAAFLGAVRDLLESPYRLLL